MARPRESKASCRGSRRSIPLRGLAGPGGGPVGVSSGGRDHGNPCPATQMITFASEARKHAVRFRRVVRLRACWQTHRRSGSGASAPGRQGGGRRRTGVVRRLTTTPPGGMRGVASRRGVCQQALTGAKVNRLPGKPSQPKERPLGVTPWQVLPECKIFLLQVCRIRAGRGCRRRTSVTGVTTRRPRRDTLLRIRWGDPPSAAHPSRAPACGR